MNALTKVAQDRDDMLRVMQQSLYPGAKRESVEMVLGYCQARGLDPMLKPVHIVPMYVEGNMRDVPLPGIALYRIQAARSGQYNGKTEPEFGPDVTRTFTGSDRSGKSQSKSVTFPAWCRVTVKRGNAEFAAKEFWTENYATAGRNNEVPNEMWARRPYGQLAKCAEAQALRMAFPELTGGEVTSEEMEGKTFAPDLPPATGPTIQGEVTRAHVDYIALNSRAEEVPFPTVDAWRRYCLKAIARLEDAVALTGWMQAMDQHFHAMPPDAESVIRAAAAERAAELQPPPADDGWPGPKGDDA